MEKLPGSASEQAYQLTLGWVMAAAILIFSIGLAGGIVGQRLLAPAPLLTTTSDRLVQTVQEVTISPNTAAAQVVASVGRSVVLIGTKTGAKIEPRATAVVITNDGLLVTAATLPESELVALDDNGAPMALDRVGRDELYGISYFRLPTALMAPVDLSREEVSAGTELIAISRSYATRQVKVMPFSVHEYALPSEDDGSGRQKIMLGTKLAAELLIGAPLLDESGRLSGLLIDVNGRAVGAETLELSLQRLSSGKRELDPLDLLGLDLQLMFSDSADGSSVNFSPRIEFVTPASPAAKAGLQRDDELVSINDEELNWENNIVEKLSVPPPIKLTVRRNGQLVNVSLTDLALGQ